MATPTVFDSVLTNPGGTGTTITVTLSSHAVGDEIRISIGNTGNVLWAGNPAGWERINQSQVGNASNGLVGTWFRHKVVSGDTLPLANPTFTLGATVSRMAICRSIRGADLESPNVLPEWSARAFNTGTANPIRPTSITTVAPEMLILHDYFQRAATNAPEPSGYTQDEEIIISGTLVGNASNKNVADQRTALSNQDASPTSGVRWVAGILAIPSPDYVYYRSGSQALTASGTSATPALPTGTSSSDTSSRKDCIIATVEAAGTPAISPNTGADWTQIAGEWETTTSGNGTTVRKYWTLYDGSLDRQFNRSTSGEIFVYFSVYRNTDQTSPIGALEAQQNASSTTSAFPALTRTETKSTVQATCVADATPSFTIASPWLERNDSNGIVCADQSFNEGGTVSSDSFTLSTASPTACGLIEILSVVGVPEALVLTVPVAAIITTAIAPTVSVSPITVSVPVVSVNTSTIAPQVTLGTLSHTVPTTATSVSVTPPTVSVGSVSVPVPVATVTSQAIAPSGVLGAITVAVPVFSVVGSVTAPSVVLSLSLTVPPVSIDSTAVAPTLTLGAVSIAVPAVTVSSQSFSPSVSLGALSLTVPSATVSVTAVPPITPVDAIAVDVVTVGATAHAPAVVLGGISVSVPTVTVTVDAAAPSIRRSFQVSATDVSVSVFAPTVTLSPVTISVPVVTITTTALSPTLTLGERVLSVPVVSVDASANAPTVTSGALSLTVPTVNTDVSITAPSVVLGSLSITVPTIEVSTSATEPTVTVGSVVVLSVPVVTVGISVIAPAILGTESAITVPSVDVNVGVVAPSVTLGAVVFTVPAVTVSMTVTSPTVIVGSVAVAVPVVSTQITVIAPTTVDVGPAFSATLTVVAKPIAEISVESQSAVLEVVAKPSGVISRWT